MPVDVKTLSREELEDALIQSSTLLRIYQDATLEAKRRLKKLEEDYDELATKLLKIRNYLNN